MYWAYWGIATVDAISRKEASTTGIQWIVRMLRFFFSGERGKVVETANRACQNKADLSFAWDARRCVWSVRKRALVVNIFPLVL